MDAVLNYLALNEAKRRGAKRCLVNELNPQAIIKAMSRLRDNSKFVLLCVSALAWTRADWLSGSA